MGKILRIDWATRTFDQRQGEKEEPPRNITHHDFRKEKPKERKMTKQERKQELEERLETARLAGLRYSFSREEFKLNMLRLGLNTYIRVYLPLELSENVLSGEEIMRRTREEMILRSHPSV